MRRSLYAVGGRAEHGFTLIEMLLVLALSSLLLYMQTGALTRFAGMMRLEVSSTRIWSALQYARSEALYSGQEVQLCSLSMRNNQRLQGCRKAEYVADGRRWDGVLLFADRADDPTQIDAHRPERTGVYDRREDLRDYQLQPGITMTSQQASYTLAGDGSVIAPRPLTFTLRDAVSGADRQLTLPLSPAPAAWCRGAACAGSVR